MTAGRPHEQELSRRSFVKGGGAVIVGFSLAGATLAGSARAATSPFASNGSPDLGQVDSFLAIHSDNSASLRTGRVELGQGSTTGLALIAAEELDLDVSRIVSIRHDTNMTPNTGGTYGSSSIAVAGPRIRSAAATARQALLGLASTNLGVPVASLTVSNGVVAGGGKTVTYGELIGDRLFNVAMVAPSVAPGVGPSKPIASYTQVGIAGVPRVDIPAKVMGTYTYVHNIRVPGMLHGRIVRPYGQGAYGAGTATGIVSVEERSIEGIGDARVIRRGDFLGVVASKEYDAIQAAGALKVEYADPPLISGSGNIWGQMRAFDSAGQAPARLQVNTGNVDTAIASAAQSVGVTYAYHYQGHMPIGPSCAVADVTPNGALVLANPQDAYLLRTKLQAILNLPLNQIRVEYWEGASSFGNGPARFDTGEAAAVMSQLAGAPVRLQLMRWDEHGWDNYGPAVLADMRGGVDAKGNIVALDYTAFGIPNMSMLTGAITQNIGMPFALPGLGSAETINSGSQYNVPNRRVTAKSLPLVDNYFKTSALRAPQVPQANFASEQLIDELAHVAGMDPYQFRLQNITTAQVNDGFNQWRDVLVAVAKLANWQPRPAGANLSSANVVGGRGIAIGGFAASQTGVVAEIEVNKTTGKILARHMYAAQVAGLTVYLDGVGNQLEGNLIMGTSRALHEEVAFNKYRTTSLDWVTYPILRFKDHPKVSHTIVQRTDLVSTGSGEPLQAPIAAAIANAFFDATGVRIREAPMSPGRARAVLKAAGVA
jgi:nicotinate dehydrogenase subunit B